MASSTELSTTSQTRWCRPDGARWSRCTCPAVCGPVRGPRGPDVLGAVALRRELRSFVVGQAARPSEGVRRSAGGGRPAGSTDCKCAGQKPESRCMKFTRGGVTNRRDRRLRPHRSRTRTSSGRWPATPATSSAGARGASVSRYRSWVAQPGSSTSTTSARRRSETGRACAASCWPTSSAQRPNTAARPSARPPASRARRVERLAAAGSGRACRPRVRRCRARSRPSSRSAGAPARRDPGALACRRAPRRRW